MSYQTHYTLTSDDGISHDENVGEVAGYGKQLWEESWKWYSHEDDMRLYSSRYPEVTFTLDGVGEGHYDVWRKWFKNGDIQEWRQPEPDGPPADPPLAWSKVE